MIYSDDGPSNSSKQNSADQQARGEAPPSYEAPEAYPQPYPQVQPYPQAYDYGVVVVTRDSAGQRFIKAFMVAVFIWLLLSLLVQTSITAAQGSWIGSGYNYDVHQGVGLHNCIQGSEWSPSSSSPLLSTTDTTQIQVKMSNHAFESETSFDLPLSSETLFFVARGQGLGGVLHLVTSANQTQDYARVHAVIQYHRPELRGLTKACLLSRRDGENGVGIFAPAWQGSSDGYSVSFKLTVVLPELLRASAPLLINNFETDIPNSAHILEDFTGKVFFNSISLRGSNGAVQANSLFATEGKVHTSNGAISGTFNTTQQLVLETSNAPIRVSVGLESDEDGSSPALRARSTNGNIQADISLFSASGSGGSFNVSVKTSNAPLRLAFPASPVNSKLNLDAATSNNPATVSLNPAYEGSFHLCTSSSRPTVNQKSGVGDPTGQRRKINVIYRSASKREYVGDIYWGDQKAVNGVVDVRSSNARVTLDV